MDNMITERTAIQEDSLLIKNTNNKEDLVNVIRVLEKRSDEIFQAISQNPSSTKLDNVFIRYMELIFSGIDKYEKMTGEKFPQKEDIQMTELSNVAEMASEILNAAKAQEEYCVDRQPTPKPDRIVPVIRQEGKDKSAMVDKLDANIAIVTKELKELQQRRKLLNDLPKACGCYVTLNSGSQDIWRKAYNDLHTATQKDPEKRGFNMVDAFVRAGLDVTNAEQIIKSGKEELERRNLSIPKTGQKVKFETEVKVEAPKPKKPGPIFRRSEELPVDMKARHTKTISELEREWADAVQAFEKTYGGCVRSSVKRGGQAVTNVGVTDTEVMASLKVANVRLPDHGFNKLGNRDVAARCMNPYPKTPKPQPIPQEKVETKIQPTTFFGNVKGFLAKTLVSFTEKAVEYLKK